MYLLRTGLCLFALAACGPNDADPDERVDPTDPTGPTDPELPGSVGPIGDWQACPALSPQMAPGPECQRFAVPLRWAEEGLDPNIELTVFRYLTDEASPRGQVWALDGGPGGTGAGPGNPQFVGALNALGFDVYIPSQRGTTGPDQLSCTNTFDLAACHAELVDIYGLEGLAGFATGEAALDTQLALAHADEGTPQLLFGTSYGTYLAMRILQIDDSIDGVVLDSSMTLAPDIWNSGRYTHDTVIEFFDACEADPLCTARFTGTVADAVALVDDPTHCTEVPVEDRGGLIGLTARLSPVMPLALTARLERCAPEDVGVFDRLAQSFSTEPFASWLEIGLPLNQVVYSTVVAHDFLPPMTQADYDLALADAATLTFATDVMVEQFWSMKSAFPVAAGYSADETVPTSLPPVLVLQGSLDQQTPPPWGDTATEDLGATLVTIPDVGHGVYPQSECAATITDAFLLDPGATLDTSCADAIGGPSFEEPDDPFFDAILLFALGVTELWPS